MKILTVVGARPQFVKAAMVSRAFAKHLPDVHEILVHTGQHYDANMSDIFFDELEIPQPAYNLGIGGGSHGQNTGRMLEKIETLLLDVQPDWTLVYGDTDSTLAGALAAAKLHIPVAHVEAGLRSFNRRMPEEINRVLTDHVSSLLFAPTDTASANLLKEGIAPQSILVVGDVMYDAALYYRERARQPGWFEAMDIPLGSFVLCTIHRAENTDDPQRLRGIITGLRDCKLPVILPLHPRTQAKLAGLGLELPANIRTVAPVGYLEMVWLEANCKLIATDSGGVQKEAYLHRKPCITLREETEWVELVRHGCNLIAGHDPAAIKAHIETCHFPSGIDDLYGDGQTAAHIVRSLR